MLDAHAEAEGRAVGTNLNRVRFRQSSAWHLKTAGYWTCSRRACDCSHPWLPSGRSGRGRAVPPILGQDSGANSPGPNVRARVVVGVFSRYTVGNWGKRAISRLADRHLEEES